MNMSLLLIGLWLRLGFGSAWASAPLGPRLFVLQRSSGLRGVGSSELAEGNWVA